MSGQLIVIDGLDGSGKRTQAALLLKRLCDAGKQVLPVSFPDYQQPSSALVREYLAGVYGKADDVSPYAASSFYAVDRYASYRRFWKKEYQAGYTIVADRYATSNLIHQMSKLPPEEWDGFAAWMETYEYHLLELPKPDLVLFLDMPPEVSERLLSKRYGGDEGKKDIHEADQPYLRRCRDCALYAAAHFGWRKIDCARNNQPRPIEEIAEDVYEAVRKTVDAQMQNREEIKRQDDSI